MSTDGGRVGVLGALRARARPIVAIALLGMLAGFAWGIADEPRYSATASVVLTKVPKDPSAGGAALERYADIAMSSDVASTAAALLGDDVPGADLLSDVTIVPAPDGIGLDIHATADMPDFAVAAANGYAQALVQIAGHNEPGRPLELGAAASLPAGPSENRSAPGWALAGLVAGLLAALVGAAIVGRPRRSRPSHREAAEPATAVRKPEAPLRLETILDAPLLATIADPEEGIEIGANGRLTVGEPAISDYRDLASALELEDAEGLRTLAVAAPTGGEDAISVAIGISVAAAEAGLRVLLVEADLAAPSLADLLRVEPSPGLGHYLGGAVGPRAVLRSVRVDGTKERTSIVCVPAGEREESNPRSVAGARFDGLVERLPKVYDLVVFIAPPILSDPDSIVVARAVEGLIVVAPAADAETAPGLRRAAGLLASSTLLGAVRAGA